MGKSKNCTDLNLTDASSLFFWGLIVFLFVLVISNFILTMMIISFFKIGMGMESIKLIPEEKAINFYGVTEFSKIYKKDGIVESFRETPMIIESTSDFLKFNLIDRKGHNINHLIMGSNGTDVKNVNFFAITDPDTKLPIFASSKQTYNLEKHTKSLESSVIHAPEVVSSIDKQLGIESERRMHFKGIEGTLMNGKEILFTSHDFIFLKSSNGSISLEGNNIYIDGIPAAPTHSISQTINELQYKLCICLPKGTLYRVKLSKIPGVNDPCRHFDRHHYNPCL